MAPAMYAAPAGTSPNGRVLRRPSGVTVYGVTSAPPSSSSSATCPAPSSDTTLRRIVVPPGRVVRSSTTLYDQKSPAPIWKRFFWLTSMRAPEGSWSILSVGKGVGPPPSPLHAASSRYAAAQAIAHKLLRVSRIDIASLCARPRSNGERVPTAYLSYLQRVRRR